MARYGPEHKTQSRERVVAEAAKAIREQGAHGISVAGVMGAAGLTHGAFYAHFPSRDALLAAGVDRMFQDSLGRLESAQAETTDARSALNTYIRFYLSRAHCDARASGCPLPFLSAEAPRLSGETRVRFAAPSTNAATATATTSRTSSVTAESGSAIVKLYRGAVRK